LLSFFHCSLNWKIVSKYSSSKTCVVLVAADSVSSKNFRHCPARMRADRLLDLAKTELVELSDQSAAKKTDDGYLGK